MSLRLVLGFQTEYFPPDPSGNAMLYGRVVEELSQDFFRIDVPCAGPHRGSKEREAQPSPANVRVLRSRPPSWRLRGFLPLRLVTELFFSVRNTITTFRASREWDILLSSTPPLFLGVGATLVAIVRRIPLVWWVQDLHPEIAVALGFTSPSSAGFRILHALHAWVLRYASVVIAISDAQRTALLEAYPSVESSTVFVLENPATHISFGRPPGNTAPIVISYTGNIGLSQGLEHMVDVAELVQSLPVRFVIHGRGAAEAGLRKAVAVRAIKNVEFSPFVSDDDYLALLEHSDVLLLSLRSGIDRYSFPSKLWTYLAAGRPILAFVGLGGAVSETLEASGAAIIVEWGNLEASVAAVTLLLDLARRRQMALAAQEVHRLHLTPGEHASRLAALLRSVGPHERDQPGDGSDQSRPSA